MLRTVARILVTGVVAVSFACGSNVDSVTDTGGASTSGAGGTTTASSSTTASTSSANGGTGGGLPNGDCSSDAECPNGKCIELAPGGYKVCAHMPNEAKQCTMPTPPVPDQCCTSADC